MTIVDILIGGAKREAQLAEANSRIAFAYTKNDLDRTQTLRDENVIPILDFSQRRLEVEIDELALGRLSNSAKARVLAEEFDEQIRTRAVFEVPQWVTSRRLRSLDPGHPSDTRVLLVQVSVPNDASLRLGQRVEVGLILPESSTSLATAVKANSS
ncbi:MAG: hypothetical protein RJA70_997 [Pseudomonadota bacterium]|jgi:hypothetical protein